MSRRRDIVAVIASGCLALGGVTGETVAPAVAASTTGSATAPQQLVNQYPLGPQRLCCNGQNGLSGTTGSSAPNRSAPPDRVTPAPGRARTPAKPIGHGASGGVSAVLLIGFGVLALLLVAGATAVYRTRRRTALVLERGSPSPAPLPYSDGAAPAATLATDTATPGAEPTWDRSPVPPVAASEAEEREFRRLDANGDAGGAFNLGVVLQQRRRRRRDGSLRARRGERRPRRRVQPRRAHVRGRRSRRRQTLLGDGAPDEGMYERPRTSCSCLVVAASWSTA